MNAAVEGRGQAPDGEGQGGLGSVLGGNYIHPVSEGFPLARPLKELLGEECDVYRHRRRLDSVLGIIAAVTSSLDSSSDWRSEYTALG